MSNVKTRSNFLDFLFVLFLKFLLLKAIKICFQYLRPHGQSILIYETIFCVTLNARAYYMLAIKEYKMWVYFFMNKWRCYDSRHSILTLGRG